MRRDLETGEVWCGECGRKLTDTAVAALLDAIDAIADLPYPRSDIGDRPWESGCMDGRQEAIEAICDFLADITQKPHERDKSARDIWGDLA